MKITQCGLPTETAVTSRVSLGHLERHLHHLALGTVHGDLGRHERAAAHLDGDHVHPSVRHVAAALHPPAHGVHREGVALGVAVVVEVLGEDAQAVARLLRLAAVRDSGCAGRSPRRPRPAPGAGCRPSPRPSCDRRSASTCAGRERGRQIRAVDDDVVVAEPVALRERDHARHHTFPSARNQSRRRSRRPPHVAGQPVPPTSRRSAPARPAAAPGPRRGATRRVLARPRAAAPVHERARSPPRSAGPPPAPRRRDRGRSRGRTRSPRRSRPTALQDIAREEQADAVHRRHLGHGGRGASAPPRGSARWSGPRSGRRAGAAARRRGRPARCRRRTPARRCSRSSQRGSRISVSLCRKQSSSPVASCAPWLSARMSPTFSSLRW